VLRGKGPSLNRYRLLFSPAQILPEPPISLVDQLAVDVDAVGLDDSTHALAVVGRAARDGQVDAGAFGQSGGQLDVPFLELVVRKSCSLSPGHRVGLAQLIGREIGHGAADCTEVEDSAGVLGELDTVEGGLRNGAFYLVDRCVEAAGVDLQRRFFGLADLVDDLFVTGAQLEVAVGLLVDDGADAVVLTGVRSDVGEDAQLVDVGVVFWVEAFYFRMKGCVGRVADSGVFKVSPFSPCPLHISDIY
jgi:hypothetical protein